MQAAESAVTTALPFSQQRIDLAAALRWTARLDMHEAIGNHFSLAVSEDNTQFLINPANTHFARIRASTLLQVDANDRSSMEKPDAPDKTAWSLHSAIHRNLPHARCAMHVHSPYATVLSTLADSRLPPIDQNSAIFFNRHAVDNGFNGFAFEEESERVTTLLANPLVKVLVMGNHGLLVLGDSVADAFNRMYYFERAARTYVRALWTGLPLRIIPDDIAEKTAQADDGGNFPDYPQKHLNQLKLILDSEDPDYKE